MTASSKRVVIAIALILLGLVPPLVRAGVWGRTAREAPEAALRLLGRQVETEGTEALARKIERLASRTAMMWLRLSSRAARRLRGWSRRPESRAMRPPAFWPATAPRWPESSSGRPCWRWWNGMVMTRCEPG